MIASGYTLDLYCDDPRHEKAGEMIHARFFDDGPRCKTACFRRAKQRGWTLTPTRHLCPKCAREAPSAP